MATDPTAATFPMKCDKALLQASRPKGGITLIHRRLLSAPEVQEKDKKVKPAAQTSATQYIEFPQDHKRRWLIPVIVIPVCLTGIGTRYVGFRITEANAVVLNAEPIITAEPLPAANTYQPVTTLGGYGDWDKELPKRPKKLYDNV